MIEIDDYTPVLVRGRAKDSKNKPHPDLSVFLEAARIRSANGEKKINIAHDMDVENKLNMKPETFAKKF